VSQENVDVVKGVVDAFLAGNVALALGTLDDEVVWHGTIGGLDEGRIARGHREVIEAFGDNAQEWESHVLEAQRFIDAGDRVVVYWHEEGRGRRSGAPVTTNTAVIYAVRGGHVVEAQGYMDRSAALKAVGLEE
jgi:ketosteroid isomerase-like protein